MQFNVRWPIQSGRLRAAAMLLALVVMAIAGSAGTRWSWSITRRVRTDDRSPRPYPLV